MTGWAFADRTLADQYLVRRIALRNRVTVKSLAMLSSRELDRLLPGGRAAYLHRAQAAGDLLTLRGIDPVSPDYQAAAAQARDILARVDQLGSDHAA